MKLSESKIWAMIIVGLILVTAIRFISASSFIDLLNAQQDRTRNQETLAKWCIPDTSYNADDPTTNLTSSFTIVETDEIGGIETCMLELKKASENIFVWLDKDKDPIWFNRVVNDEIVEEGIVGVKDPEATYQQG